MDEVDIVQHAKTSYCPHPQGPRFGDGVKPEGWDALPHALSAGETTPFPSPTVLSDDAQKLVDAQQRGLGDDVEALAKAMGADRLAKAFEEITGWDCGCDWRKDLLNHLPSVARAMGWLLGKMSRHE